MIWRWAGGWVGSVVVAVPFGTGKFEHEGLESRVNGFYHRFLGQGFEAVLKGFEMGYDVMNVIRSCVSGRGQGLGGGFKSCDSGN